MRRSYILIALYFGRVCSRNLSELVLLTERKYLHLHNDLRKEPVTRLKLRQRKASQARERENVPCSIIKFDVAHLRQERKVDFEALQDFAIEISCHFVNPFKDFKGIFHLQVDIDEAAGLHSYK